MKLPNAIALSFVVGAVLVLGTVQASAEDPAKHPDHPPDGQPLYETRVYLQEILLESDNLDDGSDFEAEIGGTIWINYGAGHSPELVPIRISSYCTSDPGPVSIPIYSRLAMHEDCWPVDATTITYRLFESDQGLDPVAEALIGVGFTALGALAGGPVGAAIVGPAALLIANRTAALIDTLANKSLAASDFSTLQDINFTIVGPSPKCGTLPPVQIPPPPPPPPSNVKSTPPSYEVGPPDEAFRRFTQPRYEIMESEATDEAFERDFEARSTFGVDEWHSMGRNAANFLHRFNPILELFDSVETVAPEAGSDITWTLAEALVLDHEFKLMFAGLAYVIAAQEWSEAAINDNTAFLADKMVAYMDNAAFHIENGSIRAGIELYLQIASDLMRALHPTFNPSAAPGCKPGDLGGLSGDCNANGILDRTEILEGSVDDLDGDGIPDECMSGPAIWVDPGELPQDSFPNALSTLVNSAPARDALDVRFDMAADRIWGDGLIEPGDSILVHVEPASSGQSIASAGQVRLHYSLNLNPFFEAAIRGNAPVTDSGGGIYGWDQHEGVVLAQAATNAAGEIIPHTFFFDLPDQDFLYPGDLLEFYVEAEADGGATSTLPRNLAGFDQPGGIYDERFQMRALPSFHDTAGGHPPILVVSMDEMHGPTSSVVRALDQLGFSSGVDYDQYAVRGSQHALSNGLGSFEGHGASDAQLDGYRTLILDSSDVPFRALSEGDAIGPNDDSPDLQRMTNWLLAPTDRSLVIFGDRIFESLQDAGAAGVNLSNLMGVEYLWPNIHDYLGVLNLEMNLTGSGGGIGLAGLPYAYALDLCSISVYRDGLSPTFSAIKAAGGSANVAYSINGLSGSFDPSAGVFTDTLGPPRRRTMAFPMSLASIADPENNGAGGSNGTSGRALLLEEILIWSGEGTGSGFPVGTIPTTRFQLGQATPNPLNPSTRLALSVETPGRATIKLYDLRGKTLRILHEGWLDAGELNFSWDGRDERGHMLASGVYFFEVQMSGKRATRKLVVLK